MNYLIEPEAIKLLREHDIEYPVNFYVNRLEDALKAANVIGFPLIMKVVSKEIIHKTEVGGVENNITSHDETRDAYNQILRSVRRTSPDANVEGILLCEQVGEGLDVIISCVQDKVFGSAIKFGISGMLMDIMDDVTYRVCPIDEDEAARMINEINGVGMMNGKDGSQSLDVTTVAQLISKISQLIVASKTISEIHLNPVRIFESGLAVLDAKIIVS